MPELSIIVPVYKVEPYLPKCIDSILAQTFTDFELILVDDGSPDHCGEICDEYAARDERIIVIHQENRGVSAARNAGLDIARGKYIGFVDSDDWIHPEMYEKMIRIAVSNAALIVGCEVLDVVDEEALTNEKKTAVPSYPEMISFDCVTLLEDVFNKPGKLMRFCFNKVFRSDLIRKCGAKFPQNVSVWEDFLFLVDLYSDMYKSEATAVNAYMIKEYLYYYRQRMQSATKMDSFSMKSNKTFYSRFMKKIRKDCPVFTQNALVFYVDSCIGLMKKYRENKNRIQVFKLKTVVLFSIIFGILHNCLDRTSINRFVYEGLVIG